MNSTVDYNLFNILHLRLENPSPVDERHFQDFLGEYRQSLEGDPDIIISYVDEIPLNEVTYVGLDNAAFNKNGFFILSGGRHPIRVKIPFENIGKRCTIVCEKGIKGIPLLNQIISLTFLSKGYIPLHASAFSYEGIGTLVMGWSKGGKTESLLSFILHGAQYIGDETVLISSDGERMFGIPVSVCLWEWQLKQISQLNPPISRQKRLLFKNIHFLERMYRLFRNGALKNTYPVKMLGEVLPAFKRQLNIRVHPSSVFKERIKNDISPVNKIILMMSHDSQDIKVESIDSSELSARMLNSQEFELESFFQFYRTFKYAFPKKKNEFLENVINLQKEMISKAFAGRKVYKVTHPYPVSFIQLFNQMKPVYDIDEPVKENQAVL